jgi:hypothetical protein
MLGESSCVNLRVPTARYWIFACRSLEAPLPDIQVGAAPENSTHVYFKDMIVAASDDSEEESEPSERGTANSGSDARIPRKVRRRNRVDRQKLIIILVGLPGRGKTFLCNKLMCYLNWCARSPTFPPLPFLTRHRICLSCQRVMHSNTSS